MSQNDHNGKHHHPVKTHGSKKPDQNPPSPPPLPYCEYLLRITKFTLTLGFLVSVFLLALAASSSPTSSTYSAATRFFTLPSFPSSSPTCHVNLSDPSPTRPDHLVFALSGSASTWTHRQNYSQLWWAPNSTRGSVWLDSEPDNITFSFPCPPYRVSSGPGRPGPDEKASDRIARILKESFAVAGGGGGDEVRWFVMGDDDTVFFVENLATVLSKYDHREMYYVGGSSESVEQDVLHGYGTAFGGGGFAVSYPLACELVRILDGCIERYHEFYGSDEKVSACVGELGVPLTREPGFHQLDIREDPYGLMAAHPVAPLVSLHHLDHVKPLFPGQTQLDSLRRLMQAYHVDPGMTVQQSYCYDHRRKWSVSISWGYTVQLYPSLVSSRVLSTPLQTFYTWRTHSHGPFVFNTRPLKDNSCERPIIYFLDQVQDVGEGKTMSIYKKSIAAESGEKCKQSAYIRAMSVDKITVTASKTSRDKWIKAPRRQCCEITNSWTFNSHMRVKIRRCKPREAMTI